MVSGTFWSLTKIISSIRILIVCTSCKTSYNVLSHSHWRLGQLLLFWGGGGVSLKFQGEVKKRQSPDFRSPEVGISEKEILGEDESKSNELPSVKNLVN